MRDMGIPSYDFGENWEGWQAHQQMVHPNKVRFASSCIPNRVAQTTCDVLATSRQATNSVADLAHTAVPRRAALHGGSPAPHLDGVARTRQVAVSEAAATGAARQGGRGNGEGEGIEGRRSREVSGAIPGYPRASLFIPHPDVLHCCIHCILC